MVTQVSGDNAAKLSLSLFQLYHQSDSKEEHVTKLIFVFCCLMPGLANADIASTNFAKNAENITAGTLKTERLLVGSETGTVAAGNDVRFETISVGKPNVSTGENRAVIWIE